MQAKRRLERLICASVEKSCEKDGVTHLEVLGGQGLLQRLELRILVARFVFDKRGFDINKHRE